MELQTTIPKYQAVGQELLKDIHDGKLKSGERVPGEMKIAERYAVSRVTARQALTFLEHEGVVRRVQGKGTFVSEIVEGTVKPISAIRQIAFVLVDESDKPDYNFRELMAVERFLSGKGISFSWAILPSQDIVRGAFPAVLEKGLCDGLLLDGHITEAHTVIGERFGVPTLVVGNHAISPNVPQIRHDAAALARKGCLHLAELVNQPIALLIEPFRFHISHEFLEGYHQGLVDCGQVEDLVYLCPDLDAERAIDRLDQRQDRAFSLLVTGGILPSVLKAYEKRSLSMEEHPIVVLTSAQYLSLTARHPGLYQIYIDAEKIALRAAELLLQMIETGDCRVYEQLEPEIEP